MAKKMNRNIGKAIFMLIVSIAMLAIPVVPHHHHSATEICLRHDINPDDIHHHQQSHPDHHDEDPCCNGDCMTQIRSLLSSSDIDTAPHHMFTIVLFDDGTIDILAPQERALKSNYVYIEALHSTTIHQLSSLRAPPMSLASLEKCKG